MWPDFRRVATTDWLGPLADGLRSIGRSDLATLVLAVIRGLLMDLDATADSARTSRAFHDFLGMLDDTGSLGSGLPPDIPRSTVSRTRTVEPPAEPRRSSAT